jgi:hypothetical protein
MTQRRIFADMVVNISTLVFGGLADWPPELQDRVYKEIEAKSKVSGKAWKHHHSRAGVNDGVPYIHVILYTDITIQ